MCGLLAVLGRRGPVLRETIIAGLDALAHRGPDGRGIHLDPGGRVGLGHVRLAVVDVEGGAQPLSNESGDVFAIVNGEIYGFEDLKDELRTRGHRFRTSSDSEVLVHLYEEEGPRALERLRGELAFVLWDARRRTLVAGRDRFGIKPLSYASTPHGLFLASEAKALFAAGVAARWNVASFFETIVCQVPMLAERTLFEGVEQVPPGHYMVATGDSLEFHRYWSPPLSPRASARAQTTATPDEVADLAARLEDATRVRLRADVPVGVYLSGGVDSSVILALAARHAGPDLAAFTIGFGDPEIDELELAQRTAQHCSVQLHPLRVGEDDLADAFADAVVHAECAHHDLHGAAKFLLSRHARARGFKAVLGGEGADELFLGYPWMIHDLLTRDLAEPRAREMIAPLGSRAQGVVAAIEAVQRFACGHPSIRGIEQTLGFLPGFLALAAASYLRPEVTAMIRSDRRPSTDPFAALLEGVPPMAWPDVEAARVGAMIQIRTYLPSYNLTVLGDRMEMAHGVEGRLPFLDHHFAERAMAIPATACFRPSSDKHVLRELARPLVTREVLERPKWAFVGPDPLVGSGRLSELVREILLGPRLARSALFDQRAVLHALERTSTLPAARARLACTVASACILDERLHLSLP